MRLSTILEFDRVNAMRLELHEIQATSDAPARDGLIPNLLACSDVRGTGWFAADAADVKPGATLVVVGDGTAGLLGILSAKQMGAGRIIAMSRHRVASVVMRGCPASSS